MVDQKGDELPARLLVSAALGDAIAVANALNDGAPVDIRDTREETHGRTPLMLAAEAGHFEVVQTLITAGADPNATDDPGGRPAPGVAFILREGGLDALDDAKYQLNRTALILAANRALAKVISALLAGGANVHHKDYANCTAIHLAAHRADAESVRLLLAAGAKADQRGPNRQTPLSLAVEGGSLEAVRLLLDAGADVTTRDSDQRSALDIAAQAGKADLVGLLIEALPEGPKKSEVLSRAVTYALLAERGMPEERVLGVLNRLIAAGAADLNHAVYVMTPLQYAAQAGFEQVAAILLAAGAEVEPQESPADSPLQSATLFHRLGVAKLLLEHGANPNLCDNEGKSALDYAREWADQRKDESMLLLLQQYADAPQKLEEPKGSPPGDKAPKLAGLPQLPKERQSSGSRRKPAAEQSSTEPRFVTVKEAAKRAGKETFYRNVKAAVIPLLIEKGLLRGSKQNGRQLVADDETLARIMQLGIEPFVYNRKGYSFMAIRAPIDDVASAIKTRPCVARYEPGIKPQDIRDAEVEQCEDEGQAFLVQMRQAPQWSVLILTINCFNSCDPVIATALASALSRQFETIAAASWDDDFSGASLIACKSGNLVQAISDEDDVEDEGENWAPYYEFFYEHGISLPEALIGGGPKNARLYIADPKEVERADLFILKTPGAIQSRGPHVLKKFGMMAETAAEGLESEQAFIKHMHASVWRESQAVLASGVF